MWFFGVFGGTVLKYFLSETIYAQENGSRDTHFAKFLIFNFLKGLTYSAVIAFDIALVAQKVKVQCCYIIADMLNLKKLGGVVVVDQ